MLYSDYKEVEKQSNEIYKFGMSMLEISMISDVLYDLEDYNIIVTEDMFTNLEYEVEYYTTNLNDFMYREAIDNIVSIIKNDFSE